MGLDQLCPINAEETVFIGVYNEVEKRSGLDATANGLYFGNLINEEVEYINYYNFSELKNFYKYLPYKQQEKTKKRMSKAKSKGKEYQVSYNLLVHDIIEKENEFIMVAEAYYPEYDTRCSTSYESRMGPNGHYVMTPVTKCYTVFVGWRYTHALIAAFDKQGKLLWDNTFSIYNILTFNLSERVKVLIDNEDVILVYNFGGYISSKIIRANEVIEGNKRTKIETNYESDKVKVNGESDMDFWYDNYFIAYGTQRIKDTAKGNMKQAEKKKRSVFYFNKIAFE